MDIELKTKWTEALRSGSFKQAQRTLRSEEGYCCLGVLCEVMGAKWQRDGSARIGSELQAYYLSNKALETADLSDPQQSTLYGMNDNGASFKEIADYIEQNL